MRRKNVRGKGIDPRASKTVAVSGGADSVYLSHRLREEGHRFAIAHVNHGLRGKESDADQAFVEDLARSLGVPFEARRAGGPASTGKKGSSRPASMAGIEDSMRAERYDALHGIRLGRGDSVLLTAHTADDQVETVLMRILEGAGISGLKGIPRETAGGIGRPLLDTWRRDVMAYLRRRGIPFRVDRSNSDTRVERNWIRHVLIPLLEKRYGPAVRKRIFTLGERFREIDDFLDTAARRWIGRNVAGGRDDGGNAIRLPRRGYAKHPAALRKKVLQILCYERAGVAPNERLLESMDRLVVSGKPSGRLSIGKGAALACRYDEAVFSPERFPRHGPEAGAGGERAPQGGGRRSAAGKAGGPVAGPPSRRTAVNVPSGTPSGPLAALSPGEDHALLLKGPGRHKWPSAVGRGGGVEWKERGPDSAPTLRKLAEGERAAAFDRELLRTPLTVRALRPGDRIRPFGLKAEKKVKEILIDRKVPRDERWGRPAVCDAGGLLLWIPGVVRSDAAKVTARTRRVAVLEIV